MKNKVTVMYLKNCIKCNSSECERRERDSEPTTKYYFLEWDYCKKCGHIQHYEKYKRKNPNL